MTDLPEDLIQLQRAAHAAWAALEAYRRQVDAARTADRDAAGLPVWDPDRPWRRTLLRPWTAEEDARYAELQAAAVAAEEARRAAIDASETLKHDYNTVQGLHAAARE